MSSGIRTERQKHNGEDPAARMSNGVQLWLWRSFGDDNYAAPMTLA